MTRSTPLITTLSFKRWMGLFSDNLNVFVCLFVFSQSLRVVGVHWSGSNLLSIAVAQSPLQFANSEYLPLVTTFSTRIQRPLCMSLPLVASNFLYTANFQKSTSRFLVTSVYVTVKSRRCVRHRSSCSHCWVPHQRNSTEAYFRFRGATFGFMMKTRRCIQHRPCSRYPLFLIIPIKYLSKLRPVTNSSRVPLAVK